MWSSPHTLSVFSLGYLAVRALLNRTHGIFRDKGDASRPRQSLSVTARAPRSMTSQCDLKCDPGGQTPFRRPRLALDPPKRPARAAPSDAKPGAS